MTAELGYSRALAGALVFSKEFSDIAYGMARCLERLGALPKKLVWDREGAIHAGGGRPTDAFAGFCGRLPVGWIILAARDPEAKGLLERSHRFLRSNFEPARQFANELTSSSSSTSGATRSTRARTARRARSSASGSPRSGR